MRVAQTTGSKTMLRALVHRRDRAGFGAGKDFCAVNATAAGEFHRDHSIAHMPPDPLGRREGSAVSRAVGGRRG